VALGYARPDSDWSTLRLGSFGTIAFADRAGSTTVMNESESRVDDAFKSQGSESEDKKSDHRLQVFLA